MKPKFKSTANVATNLSKETTPISTPASTKPSTQVTPQPQVPAKSFEDWQNDVYSHILQVTLDVCSLYININIYITVV